MNKGLKKSRNINVNHTTAKPTKECGNCGKVRYTTCGCVKR